MYASVIWVVNDSGNSVSPGVITWNNAQLLSTGAQKQISMNLESK